MLLERELFAELDEALQLEIRSMGLRPRAEQTRDVLRRLVAHRSWSLEELAQVLPQSSSTLRNHHIRPLVRAGELDFDGNHVRAKPTRSSD